MAMPPIFELRDVYFEYDGIPALHGLSVQIAEGESVALLGANGSGKSTLLRILDALYFPSRGQVQFRRSAAYAGSVAPGGVRPLVSQKGGTRLPES